MQYVQITKTDRAAQWDLIRAAANRSGRRAEVVVNTYINDGYGPLEQLADVAAETKANVGK